MNRKYLILCFFIVVLLVLNICCLINDRDIDKKENKTENIVHKNVIIKGYSDGKLYFLNNGSELSYKVNGIDEDLKNTIADVEIKNGILFSIKLKRESIRGKVQSVGDNYIEISGYGNVYLSRDYKCYFENKDYLSGSINDVKVGSENIRFIVEGKTICAVIIEGDIVSENIRVLLMNTGFKDIYHNEVSLICGCDYKLSYNIVDEVGNIKEVSNDFTLSEKQSIVPSDNRLDNGRIKIELKDKNSKTTFDSFTRNGNNPSYRGNIEIARYDGKLVIINELSVDEYLYSVVPSEMPSSYGVEALKVQAVCARSYAICHMNGNELSRYGAQVDDSINYQVYNNTPENENSIKAVDATKGEVLKHNGSVVNAYFFATSCGCTTDSTVWSGSDLPYIKGKLLSDSDKSFDIRNNDVFTNFIKSEPDTYDKGVCWYRWNFSVNNNDITNIINNNISYISEKFPKYVQVLQSDGSFAQEKVYDIGKVENVSVLVRGSGGIVEELKIIGEKKIVKILKRSAIRNLFNIQGITINKADGSTVNHFTSLPSAYFAIEKTSNGYTIFGGGYGHGVGMSQTAVKKMIEKGMNYSEILKFFYNGVSIEVN